MSKSQNRYYGKALRRKTALVIVLAVIVLTTFVYAFTTIGRPVGACPPILVTTTYVNTAKTLNNVMVVGTGDQNAGNAGAVCFYDRFGILRAQYLTDRIIASLAATNNGSYILAGGYQLAPDVGRTYQNGMVYLFSGSGGKIWNLSTGSAPVFNVHINSNGSIIVVDDTQLLYLNHDGRTLWNYTEYPVDGSELVNDGANVVATVSNIPFQNDVFFGGAVIMFNNKGEALWNYTLHNALFEPQALAVSDSHIVAGASFTGYDGAIYYFDVDGHALWSRHVNSAVLELRFINGGSEILAETNFGRVTFDLQGNLIGNQTSLKS